MRTQDKTHPQGLGQNPASIVGVVKNQLRNVPAVVIISSIFINLLELALPLALLQIYDRVIPNSSYDTLAILAIGLGIIVFFEAGLKVLRAYILCFHESQKGFAREVQALYTLLRTPTNTLSDAPPTVWLARLDALAERNDHYTGQISTQLIDLPFTILFLALIGLIGGPIVIVPVFLLLAGAVFLYGRGLSQRELLGEEVAHGAKKFDFLNEALSNIEVVKALAMEPRMLRRFEALQKAASLNTHRLISNSGSIQILSSMAGLVATVLTLSVGAFMVITGSLTIGALACCTLLIGRTLRPIVQGIGLWVEIQNLIILEKRLSPLNALELELSEPRKIDICDGSVTIRDLSVLTDSENQRLDGINISIAPGETVCLSGEDVVGRRLLLRAILGDLKSYEGTIHIDGYNIRSGYENIKDDVGLIGPNPTLFDGTILENITMFRSDIDPHLVFSTAELIGVDKQILRLPNGYRTRIGGDYSYVVSPGIHQKIAIARTLIQNTRILLIENITANLDDKDASLVIEGLRKIKGRSTIIISANDPHQISLADRLVEIKNGKINSQKFVHYQAKAEA